MSLESTGAQGAEVRGKDSSAKPLTIATISQIRQLSKINPWLAGFHVVAEWILIVAAIWLCKRSWSLPAYVATVVCIGSRQHALMILMHDGVHYRLFQNKVMNDWISEVLLAWPVLVSARAYRSNHLAHHQYLNTDRDPDWVRRQGDPVWMFPKRLPDLMALLIRDLSGIGAIGLLRLIGRLLSKDADVTKQFLLLRYGFYLAVASLIVWTSSVKLVLLYWFVPLFTWLIFIFRIRSIAEHSAIFGRSKAYGQTRTTVPSVLERVFIAPKNVSYHLEHHLYPSVPFYRLPKLHAILMARPAYRDAHITQGYFRVMKECIDDTEAHRRQGKHAGLGALAFDSGIARGPS